MMQSDFRQVFLPYCLDRQADGSYVITNRRYKPVGMTLTDHVDYMAHPVRVRFRRMTAAMARRLSHNGSEDLDKIWLYDDGCVPTASGTNWKMYSERLERLAKLQVVHVEE